MQRSDTPHSDFHCGDILSPLEILYDHYAEFIAADTEAIRGQFSELNQRLESLSPQEHDRIHDMVCDLCSAYARNAFLDGIRMGTKLAAELKS